MTERRQELVPSIEELRELRRAERAPEPLREGLAARLERALATSPPVDVSVAAAQPAEGGLPAAPASAPQPGARSGAIPAPRAWRLEPRSLALGFAAAGLLFGLLPRALQHGERDVPGAAALQPVALLPEPVVSERAGNPAPLLDSPPARSLAGASAPPVLPVTDERAADEVSSITARPPAPAPIASPETEAALAAAIALVSDLPARVIKVPEFAPNATAVVSDGGLPEALGPNLVTNGDFSRGTRLWSVRRWDLMGPPSREPAPFDVVDGALCTTIRAGDFALGGWPWEDRSLSPNAVELERGVRYRLSLRAWTKGPLPVALIVKVGHRDEPYTPSVVATVPVTRAPHVFSVAFEPHAADDAAGIAFVASAIPEKQSRLGSSELCIDDVRVTRERRNLR